MLQEQDKEIYFPDLLRETFRRARSSLGRFRHNPVGELLNWLACLTGLALAVSVTGLVITVSNAVGARHPLAVPTDLRAVAYAATGLLVAAASLWRWAPAAWHRVTLPLFGVSVALASVVSVFVILGMR